MRYSKSFCIGLLLFLAARAPVYAWHEAGHMITALVAFEQLDTATRTEIASILKDHPRFAEDFKSAMPDGLTGDDQSRWLFCQAAVWPDLVRGRSDGKIPSDPNRKTSYHRAHWHFINFPIGLLPQGATEAEVVALENNAAQNINLDTSVPTAEALKMNVLQVIEFNAGILKDTQNSRGARAVAICWLLHTVGDIHQPLHSSALFTQAMFEPSSNPEGDRGGNRIKFGVSKSDNIHSLWDDAPGATHTFAVVTSRTETLLADANLANKGKTAAMVINPLDWAKESLDFAKQQCYPKDFRTQILAAEQSNADPDTDEIVVLSSGYKSAAANLSDQRVVQGGFRLATKLKACFP